MRHFMSLGTLILLKGKLDGGKGIGVESEMTFTFGVDLFILPLDIISGTGRLGVC